MGKYKRKAKATGDEAAMEVSQSPSVIRTRAEALAHKRCLRSSPPSLSPPTPFSGASYRQLRSRRLELKPSCSPNPRPAVETPPEMEDLAVGEAEGTVEEASIGENVSDLEGSERSGGFFLFLINWFIEEIENVSRPTFYWLLAVLLEYTFNWCALV